VLVKLIKKVKRFRVERDLSLYREGFIGKPVPFTPTFLGVFILNQYFSKNSKVLRGGFKS